jgi:hypothetical protein
MQVKIIAGVNISAFCFFKSAFFSGLLAFKKWAFLFVPALFNKGCTRDAPLLQKNLSDYGVY